MFITLKYGNPGHFLYWLQFYQTMGIKNCREDGNWVREKKIYENLVKLLIVRTKSKCHFVIRFVDHNSHYMGELIGLILLLQAFCAKNGVNLKLIATKGI